MEKQRTDPRMTAEERAQSAMSKARDIKVAPRDIKERSIDEDVSRGGKQEVRMGGLVLIFVMLTIVGIFGFVMVTSMANPKPVDVAVTSAPAGEESPAAEDGAALPSPGSTDGEGAAASPDASATAEAPPLPVDSPVEDISATPTDTPAELPPDKAPTEEATDTPLPEDAATNTPAPEETTDAPIPEDTQTDSGGAWFPEEGGSKSKTPSDVGKTGSAPGGILKKRSGGDGGPVSSGGPPPPVNFSAAMEFGGAPSYPSAGSRPSGSAVAVSRASRPHSASDPELPKSDDSKVKVNQGKSVIILKVSGATMDDARTFLIDNFANNHQVLRLEQLAVNKFRGVTAPGSYTLKVEKGNYKTFFAKLVLKDGVQSEINVEFEKDQSSSLHISSEPPGASVYVNGSVAGTTPAVIPGFESKRYMVTVTLAGYKPAMLTVNFQGGESETRKVFLSPLGGRKRKR